MVYLKTKYLAVFMAFAALASTTCPFALAQQEPTNMVDGALEQLRELKNVIQEVVGPYPRIFTDTNTLQQANALCNKIDAVIKMVAGDYNYMGAIKKLENDIAPKLADPRPTPCTSWLSRDPELQDIVRRFAGICQEMIEDILTALYRLMNH